MPSTLPVIGSSPLVSLPFVCTIRSRSWMQLAGRGVIVDRRDHLDKLPSSAPTSCPQAAELAHGAPCSSAHRSPPGKKAEVQVGDLLTRPLDFSRESCRHWLDARRPSPVENLSLLSTQQLVEETAEHTASDVTTRRGGGLNYARE